MREKRSTNCAALRHGELRFTTLSGPTIPSSSFPLSGRYRSPRGWVRREAYASIDCHSADESADSTHELDYPQQRYRKDAMHDVISGEPSGRHVAVQRRHRTRSLLGRPPFTVYFEELDERAIGIFAGCHCHHLVLSVLWCRQELDALSRQRCACHGHIRRNEAQTH